MNCFVQSIVSKKGQFLSGLPHHLLVEILRLLNPKDLLSLERISKDIRDVLNSESLWKSLCLSTWKMQPFSSNFKKNYLTSKLMKFSPTDSNKLYYLNPRTVQVLHGSNNTIRGTLPMSHGKWLLEFIPHYSKKVNYCDLSFNTYCFGICDLSYDNWNGYLPDHGGFCISERRIVAHNKIHREARKEDKKTWRVKDVVGVVIDFEKKSISYFDNYEHLITVTYEDFPSIAYPALYASGRDFKVKMRVNEDFSKYPMNNIPNPILLQ